MKKLFKKLVTLALQIQAEAVIKRYKPRIIGVTGSVGKTSTKDVIYASLSKALENKEGKNGKITVRKSEKSFNSEIGIPLTVLGMQNAWSDIPAWIKNVMHGFYLAYGPRKKYPDILVLEIGADRVGDISHAVSWLHPDVAVVTRIGEVPVHVEFFSSREQLIAEKSALPQSLSTNGIAILNADDADVMGMQKSTDAKVISYGVHALADVIGSHYQILYEECDGIKMPIGFVFRVSYAGSSVPIKIIGTLGEHHMYPLLAAVTVAITEGVSIIDAVAGFEQYEKTKGRMRLLNGKNNTTIIDDTYNASPVAMTEAIRTLDAIELSAINKTIVGPRKIACIGAMMELGKKSVSEHEKIGELFARFARESSAKNSDVYVLVAVGTHAKGFIDGAQKAGMSEKNIFQFETSVEAGNFLSTFLTAGDVVLAKGSQSVRMEKALEAILQNPNDAKDVLVRQDEEWKKK